MAVLSKRSIVSKVPGIVVYLGRRKEMPKGEMGDTHDDGSVQKTVVMPVKPPEKKRYQQAGRMIVVMNGYELDMSNAIEKVYKHEIRFSVKRVNGSEKDLTCGPKNDVALILRHRVLWNIYRQMLLSDVSFFGRDIYSFFYDCGVNFYSVNKLMEHGEEKIFSFDMQLNMGLEHFGNTLSDLHRCALKQLRF
ncbi:hypothetical protein AB6A40_010489 [Gnathostoma spinigerum]|uniref:Uncharacterized protein n=1 Tax=Gnathostoma spinigerum TaxID=75299 RepID=A0ABD6EUY7_9BILA